jgi:hypothetical protein
MAMIDSTLKKEKCKFILNIFTNYKLSHKIKIMNNYLGLFPEMLKQSFFFNFTCTVIMHDIAACELYLDVTKA